MPIVQVQVWQGFGEDRARRLIEGITSSFEDVGVPAGAGGDPGSAALLLGHRRPGVGRSWPPRWRAGAAFRAIRRVRLAPRRPSREARPGWSFERIPLSL